MSRFSINIPTLSMVVSSLSFLAQDSSFLLISLELSSSRLFLSSLLEDWRRLSS